MRGASPPRWHWHADVAVPAVGDGTVSRCRADARRATRPQTLARPPVLLQTPSKKASFLGQFELLLNYELELQVNV